MDGSGRSCSMPAWLCTVALMAFMVHVAQAQDTTTPHSDTTPPNVTCDDVTTSAFLPNSFLGLNEGTTYTYEDSNPDPSGVNYNVSRGPTGDLFPPGRTPVTMIAVDIFNNRATCLFYVENTLTELPVSCPDLNRTVTTDVGLPTYSYTLSIEAGDVTKTIRGYRYHGDAVSTMSVGNSNKLDVGTHQDTVLISDEVLSKTCMGYIVVQDMEKPNVTCPADITESSTNVIQYSANVFDNVGASVTYSPEPGNRFNPGVTTVSVVARDQAGLNDTCSFVVQVTINELPVEFIPPQKNIQLDPAESTYQYPPITKDNLTLMDSTYQFYGDVTVAVLFNGTENNILSIGTYILTIVIDDTVFNKTILAAIRVEERRSATEPFSNTRPIVIGIVSCAVVLLVVFVIGFSVYYVKKRSERRKIEVSRYDGKQSSNKKTSAV